MGGYGQRPCAGVDGATKARRLAASQMDVQFIWVLLGRLNRQIDGKCPAVRRTVSVSRAHYRYKVKHRSYFLKRTLQTSRLHMRKFCYRPSATAVLLGSVAVFYKGTTSTATKKGNRWERSYLFRGQFVMGRFSGQL